MLPDPQLQEIFPWWSFNVSLGEVTYIQEEDIYEIEFPCLGEEGVEVWGIDMKTREIWPLNSGALLSALLFFCEGRDDPRAECQTWLSILDSMLESIGE